MKHETKFLNNLINELLKISKDYYILIACEILSGLIAYDKSSPTKEGYYLVASEHCMREGIIVRVEYWNGRYFNKCYAIGAVCRFWMPLSNAYEHK
jgi:hypothetical protein